MAIEEESDLPAKQSLRPLTSFNLTSVFGARPKPLNRPTSTMSLVDRTRMQKQKPTNGLSSRLQLRLPGNISTQELIERRGNELQQDYDRNKEVNFHDRYVKGEKLGEGQHASVFSCFRRAVPRSANECTPLPAALLQKGDYHAEKRYAVKIVRDDDKEKIIAHKTEFGILKGLDHPNVVKMLEIFDDTFKNNIYLVMEYIEGCEILDEIAT